MRRLLFCLAAMLLASPADARPLAFDPHMDLPRDALVAGWTGRRDAASQFDLERARAGGLSAAAIALFTVQGPPDAALLAEAKAGLVARDAAIHAIYERNPALAAAARSPDDVRRNAKQGRFSVVESMMNAWPLGDDLDAFDHWFRRGVRIVSLVHAGINQFADSSRPTAMKGDRPPLNGGLSPLGRAAVARMNDLGILIDVSQLSEAAFAQVLAISRAPVIASHSNPRALVDTVRNLADAQLDALAARGGVVAINPYPAYLRSQGQTLQVGEHGTASLEDLLRAVDYAVARIGIDHVALGSDFNHGGGIDGWRDVGETGNVTAGLRRHGYSDGQIEKLWSGNVLRVWQAAIDARDKAYRPKPSRPIPAPRG